MLRPKLFSMFINKNEDLNKNQILQDGISGIIVAVIALPLSIALAIASGVSPEKGLITAIIAGFIISFLGGSRVQIGGPTGAFVVIVYGIIQKYGIEGLTIATMMAGVILVLFGIFRFGSVIKFIPYPITTGFTSGIAVVLCSTQIKDFFGLNIKEVPSEFIDKWNTYITNFSSVNLVTLIVGLASLLIIVFWPKVNKKIPGSLIALILVTVAVKVLDLPVETIGGRFGEISSSIPMPKLIHINLHTINELIKPAFTIAVLAAIESLLSAVVADGMIGKKHSSNMELVAQGIANIASGLFGGIPATGAIARTAANVKNGGRTPIAGMVHALFIFLIMIIFMPYAKLIPMATLAAILIVVAYNMSEWRSFKTLFKSTKSDVSVLLITFFLTVVFDLVLAIEFGMILAMFLFIKKMSESTRASSIKPYLKDVSDDESGMTDKMDGIYNEFHEKLLIYEINGPLFFGAANTFLDVINEVNINADILIFRMRNVPIMDATAFNVLKRIDKHCKKHHILLLFSEVQQKPMKLLMNMGYIEKLGEDRFVDSLEDALKMARGILSLKIKISKKRSAKNDVNVKL